MKALPLALWLLFLASGAVSAGERPLIVAHVSTTTQIHAFDARGVDPQTSTVHRGLDGLADHLRPHAGAAVWLYIGQDAAQDLGPSPRTRLAEVVRDLGTAGVEVRTAQVLTPWDEAAFTWYAVNRARGSLDEPVGVIHLDDGRLLFAFVPSRSDQHAARPFLAGDREFVLYAAMYPNLASLNSRQEPACYPPGMSVNLGHGFWLPSRGDADLCQRAVFSTLANHCSSPPCSLMGTPQPPVTGQFVAWGDFAVIAGASQRTLSPNGLLEAARSDCAARWTDAFLHDASQWRSPMACHEAIMMATVLGAGLGFHGGTQRIELVTPAASAAPLWVHGVIGARGLQP